MDALRGRPPSLRAAIVRLLSREPGSGAWWAAFGALLALYTASGHRVDAANDSLVAAAPGWNLAHLGTLYVEHTPWPLEHFELARVGAHHVAAVRTPGVVLTGIPPQLLLAPLGMTGLAVAALTAALVTAAAMATMLVVLRRALGWRVAAPAAAVLALGTTFWPDASAELWTHGPDALWLALLLAGVQRGRPALTLSAAALAVLTRPHLAVAVLPLAAWALLRGRRLAGAAALAGIGVGVASTWAWYAAYLGHGSLAGPLYGTYATARVTTVGSAGPSWWANLAGALLSPGYGVLVYTPVIVPLAVCVLRQGRRAPGLAVAAALGGAGYLAVQLRINAYQGGSGFYGYRLPLEALLLCAPLGAWSWSAERNRGLRAVVTAAAGASIALMAYGATTSPLWLVHDDAARAASRWLPARIWQAGGLAGSAVGLLCVAAVLLLTGRAVRRLWAVDPVPTVGGDATSDESSAGPYRPAEPSALRASGSSTPQSMSRSVSRLGEAS